MKLYNLSGHPNQPCFILKYAGTTIMLDCALDLSTVYNYLPLYPVPSERQASSESLFCPKKLPEVLKEIEGNIFIDAVPEFQTPDMDLIDMGSIDIILISNFHCALALPYITEYSDFKGVIYATEPTLTFAKLMMQEMVEWMERSHKVRNYCTDWNEPEILKLLSNRIRDGSMVKKWQKMYNSHDIQSCMSKCELFAYNQNKEAPGGLTIKAISSGFCLGSCNWIISSDYHKFGYISYSSVLTMHPRPFDQILLRSCDFAIMCSLTQKPLAVPDTMIGEFCLNAALTLKNGGNVLVPCLSFGVIYDLIECLWGHLDSCGLSNIPLYFISPVVNCSLAYSNIFAEWLSMNKLSKVYLPDAPFLHAELVKSNRLKPFASIYDGFSKEVKTPCVVFTGHPSLRFGDAVHFMQIWSNNSANAIIFTEPSYSYINALTPYMPISMKVFHCPIDTSLNFHQANKLMKDLSPQNLVVPEQYSRPPIYHPDRPDLVIDQELNPIFSKRLDVVKINMKRNFYKINMTQEMANTINMKEFKQGVGVGLLSGILKCKDSKYLLEPLPTPSLENNPSLIKVNSKPNSHYGSLNVHEFVRLLKLQGVVVKLEDLGRGNYIVELPNEESLIQIEPKSTHVICKSNEGLRILIRDTLIKCLPKISC